MTDDTPRPFAPGEFITNPDGSWSNEITRTVKAGEEPGLMGGQATVIPTLWKQGDKVIHADEDQAAEFAQQSGLAFPTFASDQHAEDFANQREANWQTIEPGSPAHFAVAPLYSDTTLRPGAAAYQLPDRNALHDSMAAARIAGYSWQDINSFVADRRGASEAAGYHSNEVADFLGHGNPDDLNFQLRGIARRNIAAEPE